MICRTILWSHHAKTGKYRSQNKQSDVKFWLNRIKFGAVSYSLSCTFHERGSKSRFLYWAIWDKLDVQLVPSRFDIIWHFVSAKSAKFCWSGIASVSYFNIIVNTVVVIFNLKNKEKINEVYILNVPMFIIIIFAGLQIGFFSWNE